MSAKMINICAGTIGSSSFVKISSTTAHCVGMLLEKLKNNAIWIGFFRQVKTIADSF